MKIKTLRVENFRSYKDKSFQFGELNLVVGPNAAGKTNLLEAIHMLASGESFRAGKVDEMIYWDSDLGRVMGVIEDKNEEVELGVTLTRGMLMGRKVAKRRFLVDGTPRSRANFLTNFFVVLFRPEDLRLVEGSPARRRGFLDAILSQADPNYDRALKAYEQSLRRRNRILDAIREGEASRSQLTFWDAVLIKNGNILTNGRRDFLDFFAQVEVEFGKFRLDYDASTISERRLEQYANEEVAAGYTLVGPHKDDFQIIMLDGRDRDLAIYGSRGEQRLGVLYLQLGVLQYYTRVFQVEPVLLLDDIFSELDEQHRKEVLKMVGGRQTIITSADVETKSEFGSEANIIELV